MPPVEVSEGVDHATRAPGPVQIVTARPSVLSLVGDAWHSRSLLPRLGVRVIVKGVAGTKLGRGWLVLRPAFSVFGTALLFGAVLNVAAQGLPYVIFLLFGMHAWMMFERTAFWAVRSFDTFRRPVRALNIPLLLVPLTAVVATAIEATVIGSFAVLALLYFVITEGRLYLETGPGMLIGLLGYVLALLVALSLGTWLAVLNARARDVRIVFRSVILRVWLFVTPVLYPLSQLPEGFRILGEVNPVTAPVLMVKRGMLGVGEIPIQSVVVTLAWIAVVGVGGLVFFAWQTPTLLGDPASAFDDDEEEEIL